MKIKHLCPHCDTALTTQTINPTEAMLPRDCEAVGRAIIEDRVVHALLHCEALVDHA